MGQYSLGKIPVLLSGMTKLSFVKPNIPLPAGAPGTFSATFCKQSVAIVSHLLMQGLFKEKII